MKKLLLCLILGLLVTVPSSVGANHTYQCSSTDTSFCALAPVPGLNLDESGKAIQPNKEGVGKFLNNIYFFAIGIAVILAIGVIIYGGVEYALSEAITSKAAGKKRITQALFGLVLVLAPALVFSIINPQILRLDVAFEPLKTTWGQYAQASYVYTKPADGACQSGAWCYTRNDNQCFCQATKSDCDAFHDRNGDAKDACTLR